MSEPVDQRRDRQLPASTDGRADLTRRTSPGTVFGSTEDTASRFGRILENSINEIYVFDAVSLRFEMVNRKGRENLGYSLEELQRMTPLDIKTDFNRQSFNALLKQLNSGKSPQVEIRTVHRRRDGTLYPVEVHLQYLDLPPAPVYVAISLDLSREEQIESTLQETETRLHTLLNSATQFIYVVDRDGLILSTNRFTQEQSGYTREEMLGRPLHDFFTDKSRLACEREFPVLREQGRNRADMEFLCKDGRVLQMDCLGAAIRDAGGDATSFLILQNDITEQRRSSAALMDTERFLDSIIENIPDMVFIKDAKDLRFVRLNRAAEKLLGYRREALIGMNDYDFFPAEQADSFTRMDRQTLESGIVTDIPQEAIDTASHGRRLLHTRKVPVPDASGQSAYLLGLSEDITDRVHAEQALLESERRFRAIFNSTFQFIGLLSPDGILLEANQASLDFIGKKNSEVVGSYFWDTPWWTHSPGAQEQLRDGIRRAAQGELVRFETTHTGDNNETANIDFSLKPVFDDSGRITLIIPEGRDITDRIIAELEAQRFQQEMAHALRINTMGEMAATMAHELNQPLTALISYCGTAEALMSGKTETPPEIIDILKRATEQAHRAGHIIHQIRHYIRDDTPVKELTGVDQLLMNVCHFLEWELKNSAIEIYYSLECANCLIFAEKVQIEQVLINLIRNSIDAIKTSKIDGGKITLQSRVNESGLVELSVIDNGPGIDASMIDSLFKPYQTSKGKGMGLGLSISRSIIEKHGGKLSYESGKPETHAFRFTLPLHSQSSQEDRPAP